MCFVIVIVLFYCVIGDSILLWKLREIKITLQYIIVRGMPPIITGHSFYFWYCVLYVSCTGSFIACVSLLIPYFQLINPWTHFLTSCYLVLNIVHWYLIIPDLLYEYWLRWVPYFFTYWLHYLNIRTRRFSVCLQS